MQAPLLALGSCLTHGLEVSTIPLGFWVLMNEGVGLEQSPGIHPAGKAVIADSAALCLLLCGPGLRDFFFFFFEVIFEFVAVLLLVFVFFFLPGDMWDLKSPTRDQTCTPCIGRQSLKTTGPPGKFRAQSYLEGRVDWLLGDRGSG